MTDLLPVNDPETQKRRSTRIVQAVPLTVTGVDALGQPFKERTTTTMVNCHGCKYQSKHYVPKNSVVTLDIPRPEPAFPPRTVRGRVVWVQRPRTVRELFQIGLEFETAGNVWGIAFPPEDWFPYPDDVPVVSTPSEQDLTDALAHTPPAPEPVAPKQEIPTFQVPSVPGTTSASSPAAPKAASPAPPDSSAAVESKLHVVPAASSAPPQTAAPPPARPAVDSQTIARQVAAIVAEAKSSLDKTARRSVETAVTEEMTVVRQQLDAQLHEAVEKAIRVSMERSSEQAVTKVVQQASERTAIIIEESRRAVDISAERLDARIREAVEQAVAGAAESAAREAAQRASAQNLKESVDEAVERALREREASTPSLEILSSPDAAQAHLDQWRKNLEAAAQGVREGALAQSTAQTEAAQRRWQEQFETSLNGATQQLTERLNETTQNAVANAQQELIGHSTQVRSSIDEAIAEAKAMIQLLGAGVQEQKAKAEETKSLLQDAAGAAIDRVSQKLGEIASTKYEEAGRSIDELISARVQRVEPLLESSAQKVAGRLSAEMEQSLAPRIGQVQQALADIEAAGQHAQQIQRTIQEQMRQAGAEAARIQESLRDQVQHASEEVVAQSLDRMRQETSKFPAEVEAACRQVISKAEEELQQRSTEAQHETYEALLKAADWYQKKAQTTMQTSMERTIEQSTTALRDRAAEISSLVASELDHYRRTYVEHSQAQIEDAARDTVTRERERLKETADVATAEFSDRVARVTGDSLQRFEDSSRTALEKARSDMEYTREHSLEQFQQKLDEALVVGGEQARIQIQSQLLNLMESWDNRREAQQLEWMDQLKKSTEETLEQFRTRLENASNTWLLASATTLGQRSQAVLDTLAKSAEKRMRETVADVLAGMGDTLKNRLLGISADIDPDDSVSKKK
ncbi:MAG TPA: hypothetical protein VMU43_03885 [Candidatus Acidoferrum sp.]|nr:hypothetical protein [Candidatus Acidoferrum sp.]